MLVSQQWTSAPDQDCLVSYRAASTQEEHAIQCPLARLFLLRSTGSDLSLLLPFGEMNMFFCFIVSPVGCKVGIYHCWKYVCVSPGD